MSRPHTIHADDDIVLPTNPEEISFEEIPEELSYENHDSSSVEFPDSSLQLENKYQFIQTKNILVNGKTYKVIYIKGDNWYYISNDGLFSSKGNISITTRVVPYVNPEETAKDLVDNVIAYEKKRLENNTISTYRIQSSHMQGSQDSAYGIIRYNMNDGVYEYIGCYNIYKREISQDKKNIIETTLTYTPGYWSEDINEPSTIKEIIDYMNVDI
ncbi:MAG: hypothetical protein GX892_09360 [Thermoanaerobacteraceae bacterium]|nr:hypothetical protein [Thermoanaerobacteraceae bacterium]